MAARRMLLFRILRPSEAMKKQDAAQAARTCEIIEQARQTLRDSQSVDGFAGRAARTAACFQGTAANYLAFVQLASIRLGPNESTS